MKTKAILIIIIGVVLILAGVFITIKQTPSERETPSKNNNEEGSFIEFVRGKFSPKYFTVKTIEPKNGNMNADLVVNYKINEDTGKFYVKTKWIKQYFNNTLELANKNELALYKKYDNSNDAPCFVILGVGGKPSAPKLFFAIPVDKIQQAAMKINALNSWKKDDIERNFFYDVDKKTLK